MDQNEDGFGLDAEFALDPTDAELKQRATPILPPSAPTVLLVEDDPLVLMATTDTLEGFGLTVAEAATATEAIASVEQDAERFSAAIVDLGLPDRHGSALVAELRALLPGLPIIVASGYDERVLQTQFGQDDQIFFLQKPYRVGALEILLQRLGVLSVS